jgi:hypothetical protein
MSAAVDDDAAGGTPQRKNQAGAGAASVVRANARGAEVACVGRGVGAPARAPDALTRTDDPSSETSTLPSVSVR